LDAGQTVSLGQVTLACAGWTQNRASSCLATNPANSPIENYREIELFVEVEVEFVQGLLRVAELNLFLATLKQSVTAPGEFIGDETRNRINRPSIGFVPGATRSPERRRCRPSATVPGTIELNEIHFVAGIRRKTSELCYFKSGEVYAGINRITWFYIRPRGGFSINIAGTVVFDLN
jgi:hypothetical protein